MADEGTTLEELSDIQVKHIKNREKLIRIKLTALQNRISAELEKELDRIYGKLSKKYSE